MFIWDHNHAYQAVAENEQNLEQAYQKI